VARMPADRFANARVAIDELLRASSPIKALPKPPPKMMPKAPPRPLRERIHTAPGIGKVEPPPAPPKPEVKPEIEAKEEAEVQVDAQPVVEERQEEAAAPPEMPAPVVEEEPLVELPPPSVPFERELVVALVRERRIAGLLIAALLAGAAIAFVNRLLTHEPVATLERGFETAAVAPPIPPPKKKPAAKLVLDPKQLPKDRSQLVMTPPLPGIDVYVAGERYGSAADTNVVPCGSVLIRLQSADGSWKSRIRAVWLRCQRLNKLSIEPMAPYALAPRAPAVAPRAAPITRTPTTKTTTRTTVRRRR